MRNHKTWITTDTHFNHKSMIIQKWRPEDYEDRIIKNWARLVMEGDVVIHLGDVILGRNGDLKDILEALPGEKFLVRGNHDHESNMWYMRNGFRWAAQGLLYGGVWFTHAPQTNLPDGALLNVHGHLHDQDHRGGTDSLPEHCKLLALEKTDYCPVEFDDFVGFPPVRKMLIPDYF